MTTIVKVKGVKRYRVKGRWYCYHRASGKQLVEPFGTPAFFREFGEAEAEWQSRGGAKAKAGTLGQAIVSYKASPAFTDLAPRTRSDYQKVFNYLAKMDGMPLAQIDTAWVAKLRDKTYRKRKRRFANYVVSVLGSAFKHAKEYGLINENPARELTKIKRPASMPKANRPWSATERHEVLWKAPKQLRLPIAIGMFIGMREGDVLRLPREALQKDGWLVTRTGKAGTELQWPIHPTLAQIVAESELPEVGVLCLSSRGTPWTESGFRASFYKHIRDLYGKGSGVTFHGLRHTVGALLKDAGASDEDIAIALGQRTTAMARHYSESASKRKRMGEVIKLVDARKTDDDDNAS